MEPLIQHYKAGAVKGMEGVLKALSFVPEDKLDWSPTPTAKSALRIAAHCAICAGNFAKMLRERKLPMGDEIPIFVDRMVAAEIAISTRAEVEALYRKNTAEILVALDTFNEEEMGLTLDSSQGWFMPMTALMNMPTFHAHLHEGQIDYLQTCWGDEEVHVG